MRALLKLLAPLVVLLTLTVGGTGALAQNPLERLVMPGE
jgi:hypothetical protein